MSYRLQRLEDYMRTLSDNDEFYKEQLLYALVNDLSTFQVYALIDEIALVWGRTNETSIEINKLKQTIEG